MSADVVAASDELLSVLEQLPEGVFVIDAESKVIFANKPGLRLVKLKPKKTLGEVFPYPIEDGTMRDFDVEMLVKPMTWAGQEARLVHLKPLKSAGAFHLEWKLESALEKARSAEHMLEDWKSREGMAPVDGVGANVELERSIEETRDQLNAAQTREQELSTRLDEYQVLLTRQRNEFEERQNELESLLEMAETRADELQSEVVSGDHQSAAELQAAMITAREAEEQTLHLESELQEARDRVRVAEEQAEVAEERAYSLETEVERLNAELEEVETLREQVSSLKERSEQMAAEAAAVPVVDVAALETEIAELSERLDARDEELAILTDRVETREEELAARDAQLAEAAAATRGGQADLEALRRQIAALESELSSLNEQAGARASQVSGMSEQLEGKDTQLTGLQEQLQGKEAELTGISEQLHAKEQELAGLQEQWSGQVSELAGLREQLQGKDSELAGLSEQQQGREGEVSSLADQLRLRGEELEALRSEAAAAREQAEEADRGAQDVRGELQLAEAQLESLRARLEDAEDTLRVRSEESDELAEQLRAETEQSEELVEQIRQENERLEGECRDLRTAHDELVASGQSESDELKVRLEQLESASVDAEQLQRENQKLTAQLAEVGDLSEISERADKLERKLEGALRRAEEAEERLEEERRLLGELRQTSERRIGELEVAASRPAPLELDAETERLAFQDSLTGLPNRNILHKYLGFMLQQSVRYERYTALLRIDCDNFKTISDTFGAEIGDRLIRLVGERLSAVVRSSDVLGRLAEDEFVILLSDLPDQKEASVVTASVIKRIYHILKKPFAIDEQNISVGVSIGVSLYPLDAANGEQMFQHSAVALKRAKDTGRGQAQYFTPEVQSSHEARMMLDHELKQGLERGEFGLLYQPIFDLSNGQIVGVEALIRWNHPRLGSIGPDEFLKVAEESGLIVLIGNWALRSALQRAAQWQASGLGLFVSLNLSRRQLLQGDLIPTIHSALSEFRCSADRILLEISEELTGPELPRLRDTLANLQQLGVRLAVDNFGTSSSSLQELRRGPFQVLKIDRRFVRGVPAHEEHAGIVLSALTLGHHLGRITVAVGVETEAEKSWLAKTGCRFAQGNLLAAPLPPEHVAEIVSRR